MRCVTPMFRKYELGNHNAGKVVPRLEVLETLNYDPNYIKKCLAKVNAISHKYAYEMIPCNKCWACKLNYSAEWATRIMLEAQKSENNFFITLTYDNLHEPIWESISTGEKTWDNDGTWKGSLAPDDMKTFINSLRKHFERKGFKGIKYYYCGEYGETTHRPHYHIILMNCPLDIEQFYGTHIDESYKAHWKSHELERWWNKGIIDIAELEWSCAAYVARYCMKKLTNETDPEYYYQQGKLPEYHRQSKGIGMDYFQKNYKKIYQNDEMVLKTIKGNIGSFKPPKAFDKKFKEIDPEGFKLIQKSRKRQGERARQMENSLTDYTDKKMLELKAEKIIMKGKMLPRAAIE